MTTRHWKTFLWEQLQKNIEKQGLTSTFMSLATVSTQDTDTAPRVRTVVFRSFAGENHNEQLGWTSDNLVVTTDRRSMKCKQLASNRNYEACWFMNGTGEQFRLRGTLYAYPQDKNTVMPPVYPSGQVSANRNNNNNNNSSSSSSSRNNKKLATLAFLQRQQGQDQFDWEAERRRHFGLLDEVLRASMSPLEPKPAALPITGLDANGWFISPDQAALDAAYENFALIVLTVKEMDYVSLAGAHELFTAKI